MHVSQDIPACWLLVFHTAAREGKKGLFFFNSKMWLQNYCLKRNVWQNQFLNIFFILSSSVCDSLKSFDCHAMVGRGVTHLQPRSHSSSTGAESMLMEGTDLARMSSETKPHVHIKHSNHNFPVKNRENSQWLDCALGKKQHGIITETACSSYSHMRHSGKIPNYI